jgi:hypothetical protein
MLMYPNRFSLSLLLGLLGACGAQAADSAAKPSSFARPAPAVSAVASRAIPQGTRIRIRLDQTLDTKTARPGEPFHATLDAPIVARGRVVVPRGTPFTGVVAAAKSSGRFRGRAVLDLRLRSFRLHGQTYRITTSANTRVSGSHKERNLVLMGGVPAAGTGIGALAGGGTGALIGAGAGAAAGTTTAFFTGRKNVKLPVETPLVFSLRAAVPLR